MSLLRRRPGAQAEADDAYLRVVAGPAEATPTTADPAEADLDVVILSTFTLPAGLTLEQTIAALAGLDPAARLVGPHRVVAAGLVPPPATTPSAPPVEAGSGGSDHDRPSDPPPLALDPGPTGSDFLPQASDPPRPTPESVALLIGELNGRPVTADQLRTGLRIAPDKSRELRDLVNTRLFPLRNRGPDDD